MRNEYKILIGAIIVILIVLVGAFALNGSNNAQPSVSPTVLPVTATPTPVPANGGSTGTGAASPTPTVVPTATPVPSVTPTPSPSSGVKQTDFGYWITYPPLDPEKWSTNPPPNTGDWNIVYFSPTSQDVTVQYQKFLSTEEVVPVSQASTWVHRDGNLSGTTTIGIYIIPSNNMVSAGSLPSEYASYNLMDSPNITWISGTYFNLTFGPGVAELPLYFQIWGVHENVETADVGSGFHGMVKLDIVEVNDGYGIGNDHTYTVNVKTPGEDNTVYFDPTSQDVSVPISEDTAADASPEGQAVVHRSGDLSGTTYVLISTDDENMYYSDDLEGSYWIPTGSSSVNPNLVDNHNGTFTLRFDPGVSQQTIYIDVWDIEEYVDVVSPQFHGYVWLDIEDVDAPYTIGSADEYTLNVNGQSQKPVVQFATSSGALSGPTNCIIEEHNGNVYNISFVITRSGDLSGVYTPAVASGDTNVTYNDGLYWLKTDPFVAGQSTTKVYVSYNPGDHSIIDPYGVFLIGSDSHYTIGSTVSYRLNLDLPS